MTTSNPTRNLADLDRLLHAITWPLPWYDHDDQFGRIGHAEWQLAVAAVNALPWLLDCARGVQSADTALIQNCLAELEQAKRECAVQEERARAAEAQIEALLVKRKQRGPVPDDVPHQEPLP